MIISDSLPETKKYSNLKKNVSVEEIELTLEDTIRKKQDNEKISRNTRSKIIDMNSFEKDEYNLEDLKRRDKSVEINESWYKNKWESDFKRSSWISKKSSMYLNHNGKNSNASLIKNSFNNRSSYYELKSDVNTYSGKKKSSFIQLNSHKKEKHLPIKNLNAKSNKENNNMLMERCKKFLQETQNKASNKISKQLEDNSGSKAHRVHITNLNLNSATNNYLLKGYNNDIKKQ